MIIFVLPFALAAYLVIGTVYALALLAYAVYALVVASVAAVIIACKFCVAVVRGIHNYRVEREGRKVGR